MRTVVALARCSHFAPTVAVTAFTTLLAVSAGASWPLGGAIAMAVLAGQLSVGWSNDWLDRHRDRAAGRSDKPLVRGELADVTLIRSAVIALAACVVLSLRLGWRSAVAHLAAVALAWGYNAALKSTVLSGVPYSGAFALLPVAVVLAVDPAGSPPVWAVVTGALLGAGAHFTNVLPDLASDAATGVRGLPHRIGAGGSVIVAATLLAAAIIAVTAGPPGPPSGTQTAGAVAALVLVAALIIAGSTGRVRLAFPLTLAIAGSVVASLLGVGSHLV
jgi:4-hydroxybenzoate polyprenyltransferase